MSNTPSVDIMLRSLRLPGMLSVYEHLAEKGQSEGWSYQEYLHALLEEETEQRRKRKTERLLKQSKLPDGKNLATFELQRLPQEVQSKVNSLLEGDFVQTAGNVLIFGLPGRGKTHLAAAIGHELIMRHNTSVLFTSVFHLVQKLLAEKAEMRIEKMLNRLDKFDVVILDDIGYIQQNREEMEVLFTFLAERYERRSVIVTSNLVFSEWDRIFKDPMTTAAAVDRLVHHATILEMSGESYRAVSAGEKEV